MSWILQPNSEARTEAFICAPYQAAMLLAAPSTSTVI
jgi:hypothetical protein